MLLGLWSQTKPPTRIHGSAVSAVVRTPRARVLLRPVGQAQKLYSFKILALATIYGNSPLKSRHSFLHWHGFKSIFNARKCCLLHNIRLSLLCTFEKNTTTKASKRRTENFCSGLLVIVKGLPLNRPYSSTHVLSRSMNRSRKI